MGPSDVLRLWRQRLTVLTLTEAATAARVASATLHYWETNRFVPIASLQRLDEVYEANGILVQLVRAAAVPAAFPARRTWAHNPPPGGGPVWAWVHGAPDVPLTARCHWGAFEVEFTRRPGDGGYFITSPRSVPLPAAFFTLEPAGWVAFGEGHPPSALGPHVLSGLSALRKFSRPDRVLGIIGSALRERLGSPTAVEPVAGTPVPRELISDLFAAEDDGSDMQIVAAVDPLEPAPFGPAIRRARDAHHASRDQMRDALNAMPGMSVVTRGQLDRVEQDKTVTTPFIRSAVDTFMKADGRLCCDEVPRRGDGSWIFPEFYRGPVWVAIEAPGPVGIELTWGEWRKRMVVRGTTVVSMRCIGLADPLLLEARGGTIDRITVGTGWRPEAVDINDNWTLRDPVDESGIVESFFELATNLFRIRGRETSPPAT